MRHNHILVLAGLALSGLTLSGCSSSPTSPSGASVTIRGVALGSGASAASAGHGVALSDGRAHAMTAPVSGGITVTVQGTSITTTISANGTFELDDLPAGTITLVFTENGTVIGTITITSVPSQAEVDVVVQITTTLRCDGKDRYQWHGRHQ
jgi:hypothetical protein